MLCPHSHTVRKKDLVADALGSNGPGGRAARQAASTEHRAGITVERASHHACGAPKK